MKFRGTGIWHFLYIIDEGCEAWTGFIEDVLNDVGDNISKAFDSFIDLVKGVVFTIIAFPIGIVGALAHRLKRFFNQEKALKENWSKFYDWYQVQKKIGLEVYKKESK